MTDEDLIDRIQFVRAKNNILWMDILRLALEHAPDKARISLGLIRENDLEISRLTGVLARDN